MIQSVGWRKSAMARWLLWQGADWAIPVRTLRTEDTSMAFDAAASIVPPPAQTGAQTAAKGAAGKSGAHESASGEQTPFGAMMALLDAAEAPAAPSATSAGEAPPVAAAADGAPEPSVPVIDAEDETAEAVADAAVLMAGLMTAPQAAQPAAPAATPATATDTTAPIQAAAPDAADTRKIAAADDLAAQTELDVALPLTTGAALPAETVAVAADDAPTAKTAQAAGAAKTDALSQPAAPASEVRPTTGDIRRAEAAARDAAAAAVASGQTSRGADNQSGDQSAGDKSGERSGAETRLAEQAQAKAATAGAGPANFTSAAAADTPAAATLATAPIQQAAATAAASANAASPAPVRGAPETVAHMAAQIIQRLDGQSTRFDLALTPDHLGRVDVRIEIDRKGALTARMSFDTPEAAQHLGTRHAELRAALEGAGFDLAEGALSFDVGAERGGQGSAFAEPDSSPSRLFQTVAEAADPPSAAQAYFNRPAASGVDIRV